MKKKYIWSVFDSFVPLLASFIIYIIISRFYSKELLGSFFLAQAICVPSAFIIALRSRESIATDIALDLSFYLKSVTLVALCVLPIVFIVLKSILKYDYLIIGSAVLVSNIAFAYLQIVKGVLIRNRKFSYSFVSSASVYILSTAILVCCLYNKVGLNLAFPLWAITQFSVVIFFCVYLYSKYSNGKSEKNITHLWQQISMALSESSAQLQVSIVRITLGKVAGESVLAVYALSASMVRFLLPLTSAWLNTLLPDMHDNKKADSYGYYKKLVLLSNRICMVSSFVFLVVGYYLLPYVVELLFGSEFRPTNSLGAIILVGFGPLLLFRVLEQILVSFRASRTLEIVSWSSVLFSAAIVYPLVHNYGAHGAAFTVFLSFVFRYILGWYHANALIRDNMYL